MKSLRRLCVALYGIPLAVAVSIAIWAVVALVYLLLSR